MDQSNEYRDETPLDATFKISFQLSRNFPKHLIDSDFLLSLTQGSKIKEPMKWLHVGSFLSPLLI